MTVKPDDQVIEYVICQMRIREAEREKRFVDLMQVLERRSRP